jgi:hypothetical protein
VQVLWYIVLHSQGAAHCQRVHPASLLNPLKFCTLILVSPTKAPGDKVSSLDFTFAYDLQMTSTF